jgi:GT2 family glycosyltransferase
VSDSTCLLVVPTLGQRPDFLAETLASITEQSIPPDIVVVTPTGATDARRLAADAGARVLDDPGGLSAAVNLGLSRARAHHRYANWIGDDDLLAPGSIEKASRILDSAPDVAVVYGHCTYIDGDGRPLWVSRAGRLAPRLLAFGPNLIPQPGLLFRVADFHAVGGLDESLRYTMDLDLLLRLTQRGRFVDLGVPVSAFRWHADSLTVGDRTASLDEAQAVKRRYLSDRARPLQFVWERPTRAATKLAVRMMARRVRRAQAA